MEKNRITVKTTIPSPTEKVWEYYTEPKHITNWNFASNDWCCPAATNNLQKDGDFNYRMEAKDGSMGFDFSGKYTKVIPMKLIAYNLADDRTVEVIFSKHGNEVEISQTFETEGTHTVEQQKNGWQAILNNFKTYVSSK